MNLDDKVNLLLKSPTITIYTFGGAWDRSMGDNEISEGELVITDLMYNSDLVKPFDVVYFQTECGEIFEWVAIHSGSLLTWLDTSGWESDCYYADDDDDEVTPLYHNNIIEEMIYIDDLETHLTLINDLNLWRITDNSLLSNAVSALQPNLFNVQVNHMEKTI